jgi:Uma2 family endonuclease
MTTRGRPREWSDISSLLLAIEVVSPSTARADRMRKRQVYQTEGVPEYWIVDLDARVVERWRPADERPEIVSEILVWHPEPTAPPLSIDLATLFAEVLD